MINQFIRSGTKLVERLEQLGIKNQAVLDVMATIPRHMFVEQTLAHKAYENTALPIGQGQTISQPFIVALMTQILLEHGVKSDVLEVGTGSGYQAAILGRLFTKVYSVERIRTLQFAAKRRLQSLDIYNVQMKHGDGWQGWQSKGPYSGIIVTAAASRVPEALLEQLQDGGVLVIPVGVEEQTLLSIVRQGDDYIERRWQTVKFVPLVAGALL